MSNKTDILIEYGTVENVNILKGGFLPVTWENGKQHGHTYSGVTYDKDQALFLAKASAKDAAGRYTGDWDVTVKERK